MNALEWVQIIVNSKRVYIALVFTCSNQEKYWGFGSTITLHICPIWYEANMAPIRGWRCKEPIFQTMICRHLIRDVRTWGFQGSPPILNDTLTLSEGILCKQKYCLPPPDFKTFLWLCCLSLTLQSWRADFLIGLSPWPPWLFLGAPSVTAVTLPATR